MAKKTSIKTMHTFNLTYDRHKGKYGIQRSNFPESYAYNESPLEFIADEDHMIKKQEQRVPVKVICFIIVCMYFMIQNKVKQIEQYDRKKRYE